MELRQYWQIVRRRLWIVLVRPKPAPVYQTSMRFVLGVEPEAKTGDYYTYDKYYTWLTAEYLVDDAAELVRSGAFAQAVSIKLADQGISLPAGAIQGSTQSGRLHRILTVGITWGEATQLGYISKAVAALLPTEIARHMAQVGQSKVTASLIDTPAIGVVGAGLREKLDLPIRLVLALLAGVVMAFVLDYLDEGVRSRQEVESAGVQVLAEIPPPGRSVGAFRRRAP
jgi:capsular polysaccharide biosynthesis protein